MNSYITQPELNQIIDFDVFEELVNKYEIFASN